MKPEEVIEITTRHTYGTWRPQKLWKNPLNIVDAEGVYFFDHTGKRYLDFSSQLVCSNLGHKNKALIEAIHKQLDKLPYISPAFTCDIKAEVTKKLLEIMPKGISKFFYSTSGTEANEAAVKIALIYMTPRGKYKIISRYYSYHGSTAASMSLTGDPRRWFNEPNYKIPCVIFAPDAYCYRCPFKKVYPDCEIICADYVEYMIKNEANVAALIVEPVVGTNGVLVPPKEYLPRLKEIAIENDVLFIADEVMTGWLRTGEWFAINHWGVEPDILTTAKGSTSAYIPLGITGTSEKVAEYFEENFFAHGHTYEAHPLSLSPVPAVIDELKKLAESGHVKKVSDYLGKRLNELKAEHKSIGDVRGLGLFWGVEIVKNRKTKKPFNTRADKAALKPLMVDKITEEMMKIGVYALGWINVIIIAPPLIIDKEQIDVGINALDEALKIADQEVESD